MQRVTFRKCSQNLHYRQWILQFWYFLLLLKSTANSLNSLERQTNPELSTGIQESRQLLTSERNKEVRDPEARYSSSYAHSRVLHQQEDGSTSGGCSLDDTLIRALYDESNQIWIVTTSMLSEINNDLQRIVDCAIQDDVIWFKTNETIQPSTTIDISLPLTLRGEAGTTLTCPEQGELLVTSSSSFTMENIVVSGCNGSSSIIIVHPNCNTGRIEATIVFNDVSFESNTVIGDGHIIDANTSCSEVEITGLVLQENKCVGTHCVSLGLRNTLKNVHLRNNDGSSNTSQDSSIFFANGGSENVVVNMTSRQNTIRSIQVSNASVDITNSRFEDNNATFAAAVLLYSTPSAAIDRCSFVRNSGYNGSGGAIEAFASNINISSSFFLENNASSGGSIFLSGRCNSSIVESTFDNNTAENYGGAMCATSNTSLVLSNSSFKGNHVRWLGGVLYAYSASNISIMGADFIENSAFIGGCIELIGSAIATISSSQFYNNKAGFFGGAICLRDRSKLSIFDSKFASNNGGSGGAVNLRDASAFFVNAHFEFNHATSGGSLHSSNASIGVTNSTIRRSRSLLDGGAIYMERTDATLDTVRMKSNKVKYGCGGGIYAYRRSHINASNVHIVSNVARDMGGGIVIRTRSSLLCYSCSISDNTAFSGAGLYAYSSNSLLVLAQLQDSRFENNTAQSHGGGIDLDAHQKVHTDCNKRGLTCGHIILLNTSFEGNYAEHSGAAVLTTDPNRVLIDCEYNKGRRLNFLNETHFSSLEGIGPRQLCSSWKTNRVSSYENGDLVGTYGQEMLLSISSSNEVRLVRRTARRYELENVLGGQQLPSITITVLDGFGKGPAPTSPYSFQARMSSPNGFFPGSYSANVSAGSGYFSNVIGFVASGNYILKITSDNPSLKTIRIKVTVRDCLVGEEPTRDRRSCQTCDVFTYNFNTSEVGGCKECPNTATCSGRYVTPMTDHWHNSPCHDTIQECLVDEACSYENREEVLMKFSQNSTSYDFNETSLKQYHSQLCSEGYEGPLCGSCKAPFRLSFLFRCLRCPRRILSFLIVLGMVLYLLAVASLTIRGCLPLDTKSEQDECVSEISNRSSGISTRDPEVNIEMVKMIVEGHVPSAYFRTKRAEASTSQTPTPSAEQESEYDLTKWKMTEIFKTTINFLQTTTVAASIDLGWTSGLNGLFEASDYVGAVADSAASGPVDCLAPSDSKDMRAIWRMSFTLVVPCFVILVFATFWAFIALQNGERSSYFAKRTFLSVITVTYISYLGLTRMAVRAFYCVDVYDSVNPFSDSKIKYWAIDTSIKCYGKTHLTMFSVSLIILAIVTIAFPLVFAIVLGMKKQDSMKKGSWMFETVGFLYKAFKESCLFWESIVMLRKACLSVIVVFSYPLGGLAQGVLASIVLLTCLYAHLIVKPYREGFRILNYLESASLLVSCLTFILGLLFGFDRCSNSVRLFLTILIISANSIFFLFLMFMFFMSGIAHLRVSLKYKDIPVPDNAPWWRVLKIFITSKSLSLRK